MQKLGFEVNTLNSVRPGYQRALVSIVGRFKGWNQSGDNRVSQDRLVSFDRFNRNLHIVDAPLCGKKLKNEYDVFSVGSDQVWNLNLMGYRADWFFLEFVDPEQRIALSPSIGLDDLDQKQAKVIAKGVQNFPRLSVRESRGAELIKKYSGRVAEVICDPTFVLSRDEWLKVSDNRLTPEEPYIFTYLLGRKADSTSELIDKIAKTRRLRVVSLTDRDQPGELPAGPAEFISLIANASHVITDSFHASVFSSIMQTPLTIIRREGGYSMFSRLKTLSHMLGIEYKVYGSEEFDFTRADDYESVPEAIERERKKFMDYLESCLDNQLPGWRGGVRA